MDPKNMNVEVGMVKSDICRLAMMYTLGGYYFDTDILVTPELKAGRT